MSLFSIIEGAVKLRGKSGRYAEVDDSNNLKVVNPTPAPPAGKTPINRTAYGDVSANSTVSDSYLIPSGETLTIQRFNCGAEEEARCTLYYCPNGVIDASAVLIAVAYLNITNYVSDINESFIGNGTARIIMQRTNLIRFGTREIFARWVGYY